MDVLNDLSVNIQRYATAGALLYTQPAGLGWPVSVVWSSPLLISVKGSISKTKTPGLIGRNIALSLR